MTTNYFNKLIEDALDAHFQGWDFSYIKDRWETEPLPWDYRDNVLSAINNAQSMLDIGTGGGEFLASLAPLPSLTIATEGYPPNVVVARERLSSLDINVIDTSNGNLQNHIPLDSDSFDLITDRHTGASASELWRCLKQRGEYITEQVGDQDCVKLGEWFGNDYSTDNPPFNLQALVDQLAASGFTIINAQEAYPKCTYKDIGAIVYHLQAIPWLIPCFNVEKCRHQLLDLHNYIQNHGSFTVNRHRFFVHARKTIN